jgi:hypothetical protein
MDALTITHDTLGLAEVGPGEFTIEASDVGLRPGEWPRTLPTTLGNGVIFIAQRREVQDGDLLWVDYFQAHGGLWLRVWND